MKLLKLSLVLLLIFSVNKVPTAASQGQVVTELFQELSRKLGDKEVVMLEGKRGVFFVIWERPDRIVLAPAANETHRIPKRYWRYLVTPYGILASSLSCFLEKSKDRVYFRCRKLARPFETVPLWMVPEMIASIKESKESEFLVEYGSPPRLQI